MREVQAGAILSTALWTDEDGRRTHKLVIRTTEPWGLWVRVPTPAEMDYRPDEDEGRREVE